MERKLPKGWLKKPFTELLDIQGGTQPPKEVFISEERDGYIRLLQIRDFGEKPVPTYIPIEANLKTCSSDDILIARYGASIGRIVTGRAGAYNVALAKVIIPKIINRRFIFWLLKSPLFQINITSFQRTAQNGFNKEDLSGLEIPLPPLPEQQRIVAKLDTLFGQLDRIKASMERIPQLLKDFRQKVLTQAVTGKLTEEWREGRELENASTLVEKIYSQRKFEYENSYKSWVKQGTKKPRPPYSSSFEAIYFPSGIDYWATVRIGDISTCLDYLRKPINRDERNNRIGDIPYYGANGQVGTIDTFLFDEDLVCVVEDETFIGRTLPFSYIIKGKSWVNNHAHVLRPDGGITVEYLNIILSFYDFIPLTAGSTGRRKLNQGALIDAPISIAPIDEQQAIVRRVESLFAKADRIEASYQKLKAKLEQLPQALLAKAFRGELVEQLPTDGDARELLVQIKKLKEEGEGKAKGTGKDRGKKLEAEEEVRMVAEDGARYRKRGNLLL